MKKLSILLFAFVALTGLNSCSSDDDVVFTAKPDAEGISFINSFNANYVLTPATATNVAERFVWNTLDFDVPTNITYELQGSSDADFESFDVLGATGENNLAVTVRQLMTLATEAGLDTDPETEAPNTGQLYFRVVAYAGNNNGNSNAQTSEVQSITVVLPEDATEPDEVFKDLFLVGSATAAGWDNTATSNNFPLFRDAANPNLYYYTGKFTGGADAAFKLIEEKGLWAPQYGGENGTLIYRPTEAEADPAAIPVSTTGYYTLTVNTDDMTYTLEPFDASGAATYASIGIIGDSTPNGWDSDIDLTKSAFDPHIWYIRNIELTDGFAKFRVDDAWDTNWGADTPLVGQGTAGGPDIPVAAGTYDVWFNDITKRYIFIPLEVAEE